MRPFFMLRFSQPALLAPRLLTAALVASLTLAGCGGSDLPGGQSGVVGSELMNPMTGMPFIVDENQSGGATNLQIAEISWGRLVEVHALAVDFDDVLYTHPPGHPMAGQPIIDEANDTPAEAVAKIESILKNHTDPNPIFVDWVINQHIQTNIAWTGSALMPITDNVTYILDENAVTKVTRLIILADTGDSADIAEKARFRLLLDRTQNNYPFVLPKNDDGSSPEPFSFIARNSCMVIRFNDCLDDGPDVVAGITDRIKVLAGSPPNTPFFPRVIFDPNHGALVSGTYHSTRILVDTIVTPAEAAVTPDAPANALGFPSSQLGSGQPNISVRIPTKIDFGSTQFVILTNLRGVGLDFNTNGPRDINSPTRDVVRAMRAGNRQDLNNGFLTDEVLPSIVGAFALNVDTAVADPMGVAQLDFVCDLTFTSTCEDTPLAGDAIRVNGVVLEVTADATAPMGGSVLNVNLRASAPVPTGVSLIGTAEFLTKYDPAKVMAGTIDGCWVGFAPAPLVLPVAGVNPSAQVILRFSEAIDPDTVSPFGGFTVVEGAAPGNELPPAGDALVIGPALQEPGLDQFNFDSTLPMNHALGVGETFHVRLRGATDLAGNALDFTLPFVNFTLDPAATNSQTGGISLRFDATDEIGSTGPDIRGQVLYQIGPDGGRIIPRQPIFAPYIADRAQPVPALQTPNPIGVKDPLTPRGSKLQWVWRYCDFNFLATDETKYDLDIVGMSWAPLAGSVQMDNYEAFEMRLSHARFLPDDLCAPVNPNAFITGILGAPSPFTNNILEDPASPQLTVHPSSLGYRVDPTELFVTPSGTTMMPYPYDPLANVGVGGVPDTFTWRDTAVQALGGLNEVGIPMGIEGAAGIVYPDPAMPGMFLAAGTIAPGGSIPSYGLPLLVEVRCFPSNQGLGLNTLDVSLADFLGLTLSGIQAGTAMRAYSSGGVDNSGGLVNKNPNGQDQLVPTGGFNPLSTPPNQPSLFTADNQWYLGAIDTVIKVSRAHTIWLNAGNPATWLLPILAPNPDTFPGGTRVLTEFRGAELLTNGGQLSAAQNAANLDAYGDITPGMAQIMFLNGDNAWKSSISQVDGAAMIQTRLTFVNNIETGQSASLDAIGIPFSF